MRSQHSIQWAPPKILDGGRKQSIAFSVSLKGIGIYGSQLQSTAVESIRSSHDGVNIPPGFAVGSNV